VEPGNDEILNIMLLPALKAIILLFGRYFDSKPDQAIFFCSSIVSYNIIKTVGY
jgi:hypothetical protein